MIAIEKGSRAVASKEPMTYAFTHEEISPSTSSFSGWDLSLWAEVKAVARGAGIWALQLG